MVNDLLNELYIKLLFLTWYHYRSRI
ncbi:hypothetical protein CUJ84_pRLN1000407 (plasmid) [Rhizobium leguminosarum]|uniref:Uncharacterized protein n=1 Tax=Rhizobium leguminosarum TaxID=384 RepID=A0A2K9ZCA7_RHILE|nr:hypothetical protein CUJ84_pRLN1000407 [Rhizobium leguminosarum]